MDQRPKDKAETIKPLWEKKKKPQGNLLKPWDKQSFLEPKKH